MVVNYGRRRFGAFLSRQLNYGNCKEQGKIVQFGNKIYNPLWSEKLQDIESIFKRRSVTITNYCGNRKSSETQLAAVMHVKVAL